MARTRRPMIVARAAAAVTVAVLALALAGCGDDPPPREDGYWVGYSKTIEKLNEDPDPTIPASVCRQMYRRLLDEHDDRADDFRRGCNDALAGRLPAR